jgi:hypothetical protein
VRSAENVRPDDALGIRSRWRSKGSERWRSAMTISPNRLAFKIYAYDMLSCHLQCGRHKKGIMYGLDPYAHRSAGSCLPAHRRGVERRHCKWTPPSGTTAADPSHPRAGAWRRSYNGDACLYRSSTIRSHRSTQGKAHLLAKGRLRLARAASRTARYARSRTHIHFAASLSKCMAPGLRVSFLLAPDQESAGLIAVALRARCRCRLF